MVLGHNPDFGSTHIPTLERSLVEAEAVACLYHVAGGEQQFLRPLDQLSSDLIVKTCSRLSYELLASLNHVHTIRHDVSDKGLLSEWLGYRLDSTNEAAGRLWSLARVATQTKDTFPVEDRVLANPLNFCEWESLAATRSLALEGVIHGDLHPGNVLRTHSAPLDNNYWLIDLALARKCPLLFDHAYLELGLIHKHFVHNPSLRNFSRLLRSVEDTTGGPADVGPHDVGLTHAIRAIREGILRWQQQREPQRREQVKRQFLLAQVAAGLNWSNKKITDQLPEGAPAALLPFVYAADAATRYMEQFRPEDWKGKTALAWSPPPSPPEVHSEAWARLRGHLQDFDSTRAKFVLCCGRQESVNAAPLASIPWSMILDFDARSDTEGLHAAIAAPLAQARSVRRTATRAVEDPDFDRGTLWIMNGGWESDSLPVPSPQDWRRTQLPVLRRTLEQLRDATAPQAVYFVVLPGTGLDAERILKVSEAIDEVMGDAASIYVLGESLPATDLANSIPELSPEQFIREVETTHGGATSGSAPKLPSGPPKEEPTAKLIPLETLRRIEEDLEVLHSAILEQSPPPEDSTAFWRGNPPKWADLHAQKDVVREVHTPLRDYIEAALRDSRNITVELLHQPGAGGSTASLRVAWALRDSFPVAVLHRYSRHTASRLRELYDAAKRPILLVADGAVLPVADREKLFSQLRAANTRVVILYVLRVASVPPDHKHALSDPMNQDEANKFLALYLGATEDESRRHELRRINSPRLGDDSYRTPFFYGLAAFGEDFVKLDQYVKSKLSGVANNSRQVLSYLALVTLYSQRTLDVDFLKMLLNEPRRSALNLHSHFGAAASLITKIDGNKVKLLHPLIAKQVLREVLGPGAQWQAQLKDTAITFIERAVTLLGARSFELRDMFKQLFIERGAYTENRGHLFADLIEAIPSEQAQHQVFIRLTELCDREPHFWLHRGRHVIYKLKESHESAIEHLERAVNLSDRKDPLHLHQLGNVRRLWVETLLGRGLANHDSAEALLESCEFIAEEAFGNFEEARLLEPEDEHSYITPVQMIHKIAESLLRASQVSAVGEITRGNSPISRWLKAKLAHAHNLLAQVERVRVEDSPSRHFTRSSNELKQLYGNHDALIAEWEQQLQTNPADAEMRRALATAYLSRRDRRWERLPVPDLQRIVSLMGETLLSDPTNEHDLRRWFQAYKRLPEFSFIEAMGRLESAANLRDSLDAHYYLYILHVIRWISGVETDEEPIVRHIGRCKDLSQHLGYRQTCFEWLGVGDAVCPLVHRKELGVWTRTADSAGFFEHGRALLRRARGRIDMLEPNNSRKGFIRLERTRKVRAFFEPREHFFPGDEDKPVEFFMGFSYDGIQAFSVTRAIEIARPGVGEASVEVPRSGTTEPEVLKNRAIALIRAVLSTHDPVAGCLTSAIGSRLSREFPDGHFYSRIGLKGLTAFLASLPELELFDRDGKAYCRLRK
jgi:tetratricopeptide (TPR) repeat protein